MDVTARLRQAISSQAKLNRSVQTIGFAWEFMFRPEVGGNKKEVQARFLVASADLE
jgi:hypothetical protein